MPISRCSCFLGVPTIRYELLSCALNCYKRDLALFIAMNGHELSIPVQRMPGLLSKGLQWETPDKKKRVNMDHFDFSCGRFVGTEALADKWASMGSLASSTLNHSWCTTIVFPVLCYRPEIPNQETSSKNGVPLHLGRLGGEVGPKWGKSYTFYQLYSPNFTPNLPGCSRNPIFDQYNYFGFRPCSKKQGRHTTLSVS